MTTVIHKDLATTDLHVPGYMTALDPGPVGPGKYWVDTSYPSGKWALKIRNAGDNGWEAVRVDELIHDLTGKTTLANADVLLVEDSAATFEHKKILYADLVAQLDLRYGGGAPDEKVKASATDLTAGYLDAKVDDDSIEVVDEKIQLNPLVYNQLKSKIAVTLAEPSNTYSFAGCVMLDGSCRLWGQSDWCGLGNTSTQMELPSTPGIASNIDEETYGTVTKIYLRYENAYLLTSLGYVFATGYNVTYGQVGNGTVAVSPTFSLVKTGPATYLTDVVKLDVGTGGDLAPGTIMALTSAGILYAWGYNTEGNCGLGNITNPQSYALPVSCPDGVWNDIAVTSGTSAACMGLTSTGRVYTWGYGIDGALGTGSIISTHTPTLVNFTGVTDIVKIGMSGTAGNQVALALKSNGQLYTWGKNNLGQLGDSSTINATVRSNPVISLAGVADFWVSKAGSPTIAARLSAETSPGYHALKTWGYNGFGQLGNGDAVNYSIPQSTGVSISPTDKVVFSNSATQTGLFVLTGGVLYATGHNAQGLLGDGTIVNHSTLSPVYGLTKNKIVDMTTFGTAATCGLMVLDSQGSVYTTGSNVYGQLGIGSLISKNILTKVNF